MTNVSTNHMYVLVWLYNKPWMVQKMKCSYGCVYKNEKKKLYSSLFSVSTKITNISS